jgi:ABC-2 type transport system permease protein
MQVYKLCLQIIKKNIPILLIYIVVYVLVSVIVSSSAARESQQETSFIRSKTNIAFISEDNSILIDGLKEELGKIVNFIELKEEQLQDALYFREVTHILRIPSGFTEKFMNGENIRLNKTTVPYSISNTYIDLCVEQYLSTVKLYIRNIKGISEETLVQRLKADLSNTSVAEVKTNGEIAVDNSDISYFFNYFAYSLFSVIILGMNALMLVFNDRNLKMRNSCSPLSISSMNMQFILANLSFTIFSWLIMVLLCLMINIKKGFTINTVYFIISSFIFAFCCSSVSYLIGNVIKSSTAVPALSNIITLGTSFISGVFVPQQLLGSSILKIASFTPTYWYVKANNTIADLTQFDFHHLQPVFSDLLVIVGFGLAFFSVALAIGKKKRY